MKTIEVNDINLIAAFQYRLRELEWEIRDRYFDANVEIRRVSRVLRKNIRYLQFLDPIFAEYQILTQRLNYARKCCSMTNH